MEFGLGCVASKEGAFDNALPLLGACMHAERLGHQTDNQTWMIHPRSSTAVAYSRLPTSSFPGAEWVPDAVLRGSWWA